MKSNGRIKLILDIGCGTGYRTYQLSKKRNVEAIGIDIAKESIQIARQRYPQVTFKIMSAEKIIYKKGAFDYVYATDILEHVDKINIVINEIKRVLKKNGKFIIIVPGEKSEEWLLKLRPTYFEEIHHVRIFRGNYLKNYLTTYGFKMIVKKPRNFIQHIEFYYFFKKKKLSASQLEIGKWDDGFISIFIHASVSSFDPYWVFHTPLKFIPTWLVSLPLGSIVNYFGNKKMPKSIYYEFTKE